MLYHGDCRDNDLTQVEYAEIVKRFDRIYRPLRKKYNLRSHMCFKLYPPSGLIEIWEYKGEIKERCVCKVTGNTSADCYKQAIHDLEYYENYKKRTEIELKNTG